MSEAGRRARFYLLTAKGRRKLEAEEKRWRAISAAVAKILRTGVRGERHGDVVEDPEDISRRSAQRRNPGGAPVPSPHGRRGGTRAS